MYVCLWPVTSRIWGVTLIEVGLINFENPDPLSNLSLNFFGAKTNEVKQNILTIENVPRMERLKEKESATVGRRTPGGKTECTTEKIEEEKASELQKENEKLRRLVQDMAYMLNEQKESITALRRGI